MSTPGLRAALAKWSTPTALRTAGKTRVRTLISQAFQAHRPKTHRRDLGCAKRTDRHSDSRVDLGETIADLAADLDRIIVVRQQLEADIEEAFLEHSAQNKSSTACAGSGPAPDENPR